MRKTTLLALGLLCLLPPALRAEEGDGADALTAQVPKEAPFFVRLRSFDRADAIAKEARGLLALLGAKDEAAALDEMPVSVILAAETGLDLAAIDRSRPAYFIMTRPREDALILAHPAAGAAWEGRKAGKDGMLMELRSGALVAGEEGQLALEARGAPTACLDGDVTFHAYLGDLTERHKDKIEEVFAGAAMMAAGMPGAPDNLRALVLPLVSAVKSGVYSVESFDYALTWKGGMVEAEGLLATKPRSPLRELLKRAGAPGTATAIEYLPTDAFLVWDTVATPDWPTKEISEMVDKALGEGAANGFGMLLNPAGPLTQHLAGKAVGSVTLLGMSASSVTIADLKEGTEAGKLFEGYDVEAVNQAAAAAGLPLKVRLDKAFAKHGETELHRLTMQSDNMQLAMMVSMVQTFLAAENGRLFIVSSATAQNDMIAMLDKVRADEKNADHPHRKAMARLGAHNVGITMNLGALKPLGMMLGMFAPEAVQAVSALPDEMLFSTAVTFAEGDIHWRGDWPVRQMAELAAKMEPKRAEAEKKPAEEDDFK